MITPDQIRHKNSEQLCYEQLAAAVDHIDRLLRLRHFKDAYKSFSTVLDFVPAAEAIRLIEKEYSPAWHVLIEVGSLNNCFVTLDPKTDGSE